MRDILVIAFGDVADSFGEAGESLVVLKEGCLCVEGFQEDGALCGVDFGGGRSFVRREGFGGDDADIRLGFNDADMCEECGRYTGYGL